MKTKNVIGLISAVIGALLTYGAFVFLLLEFNPIKWHEALRFMFIGLIVVITVGAWGLGASIYENEIKPKE